MKCKYCGEEKNDGASFCPCCAKRLICGKEFPHKGADKKRRTLWAAFLSFALVSLIACTAAVLLLNKPDAVGSAFLYGAGTPDDPYIIKTSADFKYLAESVNGGETYEGKYIRLENDIAFNDERFEFIPDTGLIKVTDGAVTAFIGTGLKGNDSGDNALFDTKASENYTWYDEGYNKINKYPGTIEEMTPIGGLFPIQIKNNDEFISARQKYYVYCEELKTSSVYSAREYIEDANYYIGRDFDGDFDGNGHTLSGVFINFESIHSGLFGTIGGEGKLYNLTLGNSYFCGRSSVGGIAGANCGIIENCISYATVCTSYADAGGIAGWVSAKNSVPVIENCKNYGTVIGIADIGGIAGANGAEASISGCTNHGSVYSERTTGGICGISFGRILCSYNYGKIYTEKQTSGGICGNLGGGTAYKCTNFGDVSGRNNAGGICGDAYFASTIRMCVNNGNIKESSGTNHGGICGCITEYSLIESCYNTGSVLSLGNYVGGICGISDLGIIKGCYNAGHVEAYSLVGAICGSDRGNSEISGCYYLGGLVYRIQYDYKSVFNYGIGNGIPDKTAESKLLGDDEAKSPGSYMNWDFDTVWMFDENSGYSYPVLKDMGYNG